MYWPLLGWQKNKKQTGFTLIELLVVIAIVGLLATIVLSSIKVAKDKTYFSRALTEFKSMATALQYYLIDYDQYPADVSRDLPPGLGQYLAGQNISSWPSAPWPNSVYDWDNWDDPNTPGAKIYQISIRFCPIGAQISQCSFPKESWASNFGVDSAVYYCIEGSCRPHINQPVTYPGYCVNC